VAEIEFAIFCWTCAQVVVLLHVTGIVVVLFSLQPNWTMETISNLKKIPMLYGFQSVLYCTIVKV
jgi:hypothetical protein